METVYSIYVQDEFYETWEFEQDAVDRVATLKFIYGENVFIKKENCIND